MWLYKHKYNADGSLNQYKARLVPNGHSQQQGIDCDETFSPVVKPATIWTGLSLGVSQQWPIHQLDVKNAFLYGHLIETLYMHRPPRFIDSAHSDYVCLLQKLLYGLKQALRAWFQRFSIYVIRAGFYHIKTDSSLFIFLKGPDTAYLLLYVDDIILTASSTSLLQHIISSLHAKFSMIDIGQLNYFLGCSAMRQSSSGYCFFLGDNLPTWSFKRQDTLSCSSAEVEYCEVANAIAETSWIHNLLHELHTLLFTATLSRPSELGFNNFLSMLFEPVSITAKQTPSSTSLLQRIISLLHAEFAMIDTGPLNYFLGCPTTCQSTSGYCVFLGDNLPTWSFKRQDTLSCSSAEVEYCEVANAIAETSWICNLLRELHTLLFTATLVYCDNVCAVYMSANPVQHQHTKHIEIDIHFVHDKVVAGHVQVRHVLSRFQYAYFFTKGLSDPLFVDFRSILSVRKSSAPTARAY
uniref:Ribonuclease H-like domain-containing protein n=1 Tax=Tanacetum cinerariifolium TaxID=118510 RepID=A0A6L2LMP9_TANCI|nr:ribonuclease H-like domain-containing protein [Tanacetum cinerariifolium]